MYPLSLHTLGAGNWQYLYLAQLLAAAENIYRIRPIQVALNSGRYDQMAVTRKNKIKTICKRLN